jgi:hypothetical protein
MQIESVFLLPTHGKGSFMVPNGMEGNIENALNHDLQRDVLYSQPKARHTQKFFLNY